MKGYLIALSLFFYSALPAQVGQVAVPRIELMPEIPSPFLLKDWHAIALGYDAFVFDQSKTGQYLPLVTVRPSGQNYPENNAFGLHSYVGTNSPNNGEAINVLPALIGASLNGIDKSNQNGMNWVLMSQDYFNKNNGESVYLNGPATRSGGDWWYETMPNVYFYQLYDIYGNIGAAAMQFLSVADRFAEAVRAMGGNDTPWEKAWMNYRAWDFVAMEPLDSGVAEPEAAGAFAWVLYHAFKRNGDPEYLKAAEWSMEFLESWPTNPSYELQLPYGTYVAAKMNAEIGTQYDIEKMVNWSFDRGDIRGWGTIVGKWGGVDVSGLVGEANDNGNDYAFQMNGVQQAAALVPMVRYDKRFAKAIGKWFLNLANATRFMFPGGLPASLQDASAWSEEYDPEGVIGYEALREVFSGLSPYATGDATGGGWAETNLALYGTSSIGYLGSLFNRTDIPEILQIDLLKTDFFRDTAYPSYLFYNPHPNMTSVTIDIGGEATDIYEALSESFLLKGASGMVSLNIPGNAAISIVLAPAGGTVSYQENTMQINGVIVDFAQQAVPYDAKPRIQALAAKHDEVLTGDTITLYATATDRETQNLMFAWQVSDGKLLDDGATVDWVAPGMPDTVRVQVVITDAAGQKDTSGIELRVVEEINIAPEILELVTEKRYAEPGQTLSVRCLAQDQNDDTLSYTWSASAGTIQGEGDAISWISPGSEGIANIQVVVEDGDGASVSAETNILIRTFPVTTGNLIAHYPFSGNALDVSGNALHGDVFGAKLTEDRFGNGNRAYFFDGANDHISVANDPVLDIREAITISCWIHPLSLPDREHFIISHGSWQNRWKISIIPERKIRWTIQNESGQIRDLDSDIMLDTDSTYHLSATYDGSLMLLYVNGEIRGFQDFSGRMNSVAIDMEIAQMLPDNNAYNFNGVLDDIRIYDYALHPDTVFALAGNMATNIHAVHSPSNCIQLYPNPTCDFLIIKQCPQIMAQKNCQYSIYTTSGLLVQEIDCIGFGEQRLDVRDLLPGLYFIQIQTGGMQHLLKFIKRE